MNKYQKILTIAALVIFSAISPSTASETRDGYWWREQKKAAIKTAYVAGMNEGAAYVAGVIQATPADTGLTSVIAKVTSKLFNGEFTAKQLTAGMDQFYSDKRNKRVRTECAFHVVIMQLNGASKSDTEEFAEKFRSIYQ